MTMTSSIFTIFFTLICLTCNTIEAASAVHATALSQESQATTALAQLFTVAEAEEPIYLILIEKNRQRLRVLEHDGELKVVAEYFSATGENSGIKEFSGDAKTPEGVYFITKVFIDKKVTIFGDKAFHLDYPNFFDLEAGRNGDGIYIHGTNTELKPFSTNGCVTMANDDLDDLEKYLNQAVTPVVIVPELKLDRQTVNQLLTKQDFDLAKSLLLNDGIRPANVEYNYLYVVNLGSQAVAVADFVYRPYERSMMRGASRSYLEFRPGNGWATRKRLWRTSPLQIYPESPVKIAARPFTVDQIQIAGQPVVDTSSMVTALNLADQGFNCYLTEKEDSLGGGFNNLDHTKKFIDQVKKNKLIINTFMEEFDIILDTPGLNLSEPKLDYLLIKVNGSNSYAMPHGSQLTIKPGDEIIVTDIIANYKRGMVVDVEDHGNKNDTNIPFRIIEPTRVMARKDGQVIGWVDLVLEETTVSTVAEAPPLTPDQLEAEKLLVHVNDKIETLDTGKTLLVQKGTRLILKGIRTNIPQLDNEVFINFKGFAPPKAVNDGNDLDFPIYTSQDLWPRYSENKQGKRYPVVATYNNITIGKFWIELAEN